MNPTIHIKQSPAKEVSFDLYCESERISLDEINSFIVAELYLSNC